ncbi:hypothetical protein B0H14DRAFT_3479445 [Mycena olivaceomarginata]|nr:hypothetical protein B0H14DRAFT_3479445 [Mycena olivaceomarginata]
MDMDPLPADKDPAMPPTAKDVGSASPADKDAAALPANKDTNDASLDTLPIVPLFPSLLCALCPAKHRAVLELFDMEVEGALWKLTVRAWLTLEHTSGFQAPGKALSAAQHPGAVLWWVQRGRSTSQIPAGLNNEDKWQDFYEGGYLVVVDRQSSMEERGAGGDLESLSSGLNRLTSILVCLGWWYCMTGVIEGTPKVLVHKQATCISLENPTSKRRHVE